MILKNYKNKKILIMGLGLHGGGVSVANYFLKRGAKVRITDLKTHDELFFSIKNIKSKKVDYTLGKHFQKDFLWADMVVQNPGVARESKFLKIARDHGAVIENEATLFFKIIGRERIIGVTGTRGKSTTATLIYKLLKEKYPNTLIGGNIATTPMLSIISKAKRTKDPIVLELSSWHLENLGEQQISPRISVFTNLYYDHLNRYKDMHNYGQAKQNIFKYQSKSDYAVLNWDNFFTLMLSKNASSQVYWFGKGDDIDKPGCFIKEKHVYFATKEKEEKVLYLDNLHITGEHNHENILAAVCVAKIFGLENNMISKVVKNFRGLKHRLEFVKEVKKVKYCNDTTATTPDGTLAALKALSPTASQASGADAIVLIAGGSDKQIPQDKYNELGQEIQKYCKGVIVFEGDGSEKLITGLHSAPFTKHIFWGIKTMADALGLAKSIAKKGDIVLLSPACASFGLFTNEFDRGNQFKELVLGFK